MDLQICPWFLQNQTDIEETEPINIKLSNIYQLPIHKIPTLKPFLNAWWQFGINRYAVEGM